MIIIIAKVLLVLSAFWSLGCSKEAWLHDNREDALYAVGFVAFAAANFLTAAFL